MDARYLEAYADGLRAAPLEELEIIAGEYAQGYERGNDGARHVLVLAEIGRRRREM